MSIAHSSGRQGWRTVALVVGAGVVSAFQVGKAPIALDAIRADLAIGLTAASWILSAFALIGALASVAIGGVVDRAGAKQAVVYGLLLQASGSAIGAVSANLPLLVATRAIEGLGFLAVTIAAPSLIVAASRPQERARAFAAWATFMPVGMALMMFCAPALHALGWRGIWHLNAAILAGFALWIAIAVRGVGTGGGARVQPGTAAALSRTLGVPGPWLLAGIFGAYTAAYFSLFGFLPTLLSDRLGVEAGTAGVLSAIAVAAGAAGCLACGHRLGAGARATTLMRVGFAAMALGGIGVLALPLPGGYSYLLCVVISFVGAFIPTAIFDAAPRHSPRPELLGTTVGLATQGNSIGVVIGPLIASAIAATAGWAWVAAFMVAVVVLGGLGAIALQGQPGEAAR
ncbi:MFS transporter [Flavobacterium sp. MXW15]|uniref:MFS transporter n=1 Tax=Xanthomonas chitinilytica TaxID=2989819 RepID=A0ABT3JYU5_9XANT|nr:MFS transporter [Xanthomonas sp. H13-6]MCW4456037.1 MFS transporter [Flavobacterium sp. MXW15]MCW4473634.1 MFS transporter [Xanthomonas sp. H13-6]